MWNSSLTFPKARNSLLSYRIGDRLRFGAGALPFCGVAEKGRKRQKSPRGESAIISGLFLMKYIKQFSIILVFTLMGEALNYFLPLPVPAGVYGIALLFFALETGIVKTEQVEDTGKFLIEIMPVMFISPAVGLIDAWANIKANLLSYFAVTALTTVLVMSVSALTTQGVITLCRKRRAANPLSPRARMKNVASGELAATVTLSETASGNDADDSSGKTAAEPSTDETASGATDKNNAEDNGK